MISSQSYERVKGACAVVIKSMDKPYTNNRRIPAKIISNRGPEGNSIRAGGYLRKYWKNRIYSKV